MYFTGPDRAGEYLRRAYELNDEIGFPSGNAATAMFLALHELRGGDPGTAAHWATRSLHLATTYAPTLIAQTLNAIVPITKRHSPAHAAELLGALRAYRSREDQAGTQPEIDAETRYETSLRRQLGDQFDARYAQGLALDEPDMIALAFTQLDAVTTTSGAAIEAPPDLS